MKRALFAAALGLVSASGFAATTGITMYKSPSCGCCSEWAKHMQQAGYEVTTVMLDDNALYQLKQKHHITPELMSCHTAIVGDYAIEGMSQPQMLRACSKKNRRLAASAPRECRWVAQVWSKAIAAIRTRS